MMQRIINGVLYDTNADGTVLLYVDEGNGRRYYSTARGSFFIVFVTGEFRVVTADFMKTFLGKYDIEKYIEVFGTPKEG